MSPYTFAWFERRSERMLSEFGLTEPVHEPIYRERMPHDDKPAHFSPIERESLMVLASMRKELH